MEFERNALFESLFKEYRNPELEVLEVSKELSPYHYSIASHLFHERLRIFLRKPIQEGYKWGIGLSTQDTHSIPDNIFHPYLIEQEVSGGDLIFREHQEHYVPVYPRNAIFINYLAAKAYLLQDMTHFCVRFNERMDMEDHLERAAQQPSDGERYQPQLPDDDNQEPLEIEGTWFHVGYELQFKIKGQPFEGLVPHTNGREIFFELFYLDPRIALSYAKAGEIGEAAANFFCLVSELGGVERVQVCPLFTAVRFENTQNVDPVQIAGMIARSLGRTSYNFVMV